MIIGNLLYGLRELGRHHSLLLFPGLAQGGVPLINAHSFLVACMQGIQFPLDHFMDPFPILCVWVWGEFIGSKDIKRQ